LLRSMHAAALALAAVVAVAVPPRLAVADEPVVVSDLILAEEPLPGGESATVEAPPAAAISQPEAFSLDGQQDWRLEEYAAEADFNSEPVNGGWFHRFLPKPRWLGLRHSSTHGRHAGLGRPLVGTSWRNRPFYVGGELGTLWITRPIHDNVNRDIDAFGGIFFGWDSDHYWGHELRFDWSTPELKNSEARDADRTDSLFAWSYNAMYYPWGDAKFRPYWRAGIGNTRFDFPLDDGSRHDEWMLTFPLGIGVKYPVRRWLAARADLTDHLTIDGSDLPTMNNLTLTFGLEWHFGAHPRSYWPWNPSRHIW